MSNFQELQELVIQWGKDKGILGEGGKGTIKGQIKKFGEESNELIESVGYDLGFADSAAVFASGGKVSAGPSTIDAVGDTLITVILLCEMCGISAEECLQEAYTEISGRTGHMKDGIFVRDK